MKLNNLELCLIKKFIARNPSFDFDKSLEVIDVTERLIEGKGFFTTLNILNAPHMKDEKLSFQWGEIGAKVNNETELDFLFFIENGILKMIEGYTLSGDDFPKDISKVDIYDIKLTEYKKTTK